MSIEDRIQNEPGRWSVITNDVEADECLEELGRLQAQHDANEELANERVAKIEAWRKEMWEKLQPAIEEKRVALEKYAIAQREQDEHRKTFDLPCGVIRTTSQPAKLTIENQAEVLEWARKHHPKLVTEDIKVTPKVAHADVAKIALEDGEVVPGTSITDPRITATVTAK